MTICVILIFSGFMNLLIYEHTLMKPGTMSRAFLDRKGGSTFAARFKVAMCRKREV